MALPMLTQRSVPRQTRMVVHPFNALYPRDLGLAVDVVSRRASAGLLGTKVQTDGSHIWGALFLLVPGGEQAAD